MGANATKAASLNVIHEKYADMKNLAKTRPDLCEQLI